MAAMVIAATAVLVPASFVQNPLPIPALTIAVGGIIASWLTFRFKMAFAFIGAVLGLGIGAVLHYRMHVTEDRLLPIAEMVRHLAADASFGLPVAVLSLGAAFGLRSLVDRRRRSPELTV